MGYACPVCADPQADAGHLANHLAFTAMLGDEDHEHWLDEHASGWGEMGESELAEVVADLVEETEFPQVFEDTVGGLEETPEDPAGRSGALFEDDHDHAGRAAGAAGDLDEETAAILEEAREMTRQMLGDEAADETAADDENE
jgi:hypothetical protein